MAGHNAGGMLCLPRAIGQGVLIGLDYSVRIKDIKGSRVLLRIDDPEEYDLKWVYPREPVRISASILVKVLQVMDGEPVVRLGVQAPREVQILREEVNGVQTVEDPYCDFERGTPVVRPSGSGDQSEV